MVMYIGRRALLAFGAAALAPTAFAAAPIKIGFGIGLTGSVGANGKAALLAMQIWAEDINASGGLLGRKVELVYYDDQSNGSLVPGIYSKLLTVDNVDLIVSGYGTNFIAPAIPIAMRKHMVLMSLFGTNSNSQFKYDRYFEIKPNGKDPATDFSQGFFDVVQQMMPKPKTIALMGVDNEYGAMVLEGARNNIKKLGLTIAYDKTYPANTSNFSPLVASVSALKPDVVFVASFPPDTVGIVRAANEVKLQTSAFGGGMVGLQYASIKTQLASMMNGLISPEVYVPSPTLHFDGIDDFLTKYRPRAQQSGVDALGFYVPPFAYAMMQVLGEAVKTTGGLDQAKLATFIHATTFHTVVGDVKFGVNGEWQTSRILWSQYHDVAGADLAQFLKPGKLDILSPAALRTGKLRYPYSKLATQQ